MHTDILDLREFYLSSLGLTVRQRLRKRLRRIWPQVRGEKVLTLGYGTPLLRPILKDAAAVFAMMPAQQGVAFWPREGPNCSSLVDFNNLPLPDNSIDRIVLFHAVEVTSDPAEFLDELFRILKPNGRMLLVVPNRLGIWAHSERTPFGNGQPYSARQVRNLLTDHGFFVDRTWPALFFPPTSSRIILSFSELIERLGERLFPSFGGVLVTESGKQVYAPLLTKAAPRQRRMILPLPMPSPMPPIPAGRG